MTSSETGAVPSGRECRADERVQLVLPRQARRGGVVAGGAAGSAGHAGLPAGRLRHGDRRRSTRRRFVLFDDDTRLAFITSFDGPWDAYMADFFTSGPTLELFNIIFGNVEGYDGLPDIAALQAFILDAQQTAAAYARNYGGTVKEIRKAQRVNAAFQQVLDHPDAEAALQHPALQPLLDEAGD